MQEDLIKLISNISLQLVEQKLGYEGDYSAHLELFVSLVIMGSIILLIYFTTKKLILNTLQKFFLKTEVTWDDHLVERKVFNGLPFLFPSFLAYKSVPIIFRDFTNYISIFQKSISLIILYVIIGAIIRFANAVGDAIATQSKWKDKPIFSYVQLVQIIAILIAIIFTISIIFAKSPLSVLGAAGAAAAILLLVFKDSILGFVASMQISANDLVRVGDWVTVKKFGADGNIEQINLFTVKIRNFDKTVVTVPTTAFTVEGVQNWRGMTESGGRRIKRNLDIDLTTVKFASHELLEELKKIHLLKPYIEEKEEEIKKYNEQSKIDDTIEVNGRRQTNLGLFRAYTELYLRNNPKVNQDMLIMVRQLQPEETGLPLEVYCFSKSTAWVDYEKTMADIFDHLLAVIKRFDLRIYQNPSSEDFRKVFK